MKNYLSFGGGVNSVAMYLYLFEQDVDFEAVFVDHGGDWPETYEYVEMFSGKYPLTILRPDRADSILEYCRKYKITPGRRFRWCTRIFKSDILTGYHETPCFVFIGFDYGERHRAKIYTNRGQEFRYPLIEAEIDRRGCKDIIRRHGLQIPIKSGCFICPFQRVGQLRELRKKHPDLFCVFEQLENRCNDERVRRGLDKYYSFRKPVREIAEKNINQRQLWPQDEYPPCECGL